MKVFISWSGPKSQAVAKALREWIPFVINEVQPFISTEIESGQRWSAVIAEELEATSFGIICTTAANQHAPWLNFEAGALAKQIGDARVAPLAIDLKPSEIEQPLGQFNGDRLDKEGIRKLMHSLNKAAASPLELKLLDPAIDMWWPKLEGELSQLPDDSVSSKVEPARGDRDILLEVLDSVRGLVRGMANSDFGFADEGRSRPRAEEEYVRLSQYLTVMPENPSERAEILQKIRIAARLDAIKRANERIEREVRELVAKEEANRAAQSDEQ